jgi:hypothetical protein
MRIDFGAQVSLETIGRDALEFCHWWASEISEVLPERWRDMAAARLAQPQMRLEAGTWIVSCPGLQDIDLDASLDAAGMRGRLAGIEQLAKPVRFELPEREVLRRTITLPKAASARLRSAISLQLDHHSPFRSEDVVFDFATPKQNAGGEDMDVDVAIVPLATLSRHEEWLGEIGLHIAEFRVEGSGHRFAGPTNWRLTRPSTGFALAAAGCALWILALILAPVMRDTEIEKATAEVAGLQAISSDALRDKEALEQLSGPAEFLGQKELAPLPLDVLRTLTLAFPNNVRLIDLVVTGNRVQATGFTNDAYLLTEILVRGGKFSDVRLAGPIEKYPDGRQRFELELTLRMRQETAS